MLPRMVEGRLAKSLFSPSYTRFLDLLKQARLEAGLTQSEAARRLGKPQSFISKCESGERRIDVVEFLEFCRIFGADPGKILSKLDNPPKSKG
jgi:transcriptional regulator with XRE-family HTH domain